MKRLVILSMLFVVLSLVGTAPLPSATGQVSCTGVIVHTPVGIGLPVMAGPDWFSLFTGRNLQESDLVTVIATHYRLWIGDIWFQIDGGWVQAYSGYTTGITQVILGDYPCAVSLPHEVGD